MTSACGPPCSQRTVTIRRRTSRPRCSLATRRIGVALETLAARCDALTFDHELVDLDLLRALEASGCTVRPSPGALVVAVDKAAQRRRLSEAGLPVPRFAVLDGDAAGDLAALEQLADDFGARARREGGAWRLRRSRRRRWRTTLAEAADAVAAWRSDGVEVVAEEQIDFRAELAALVARRPDGECVSWRTVRHDQVDGMCREIRVPGRRERRRPRGSPSSSPSGSPRSSAPSGCSPSSCSRPRTARWS